MFFNINYSWLEWVLCDYESDCYEIELIELNQKIQPEHTLDSAVDIPIKDPANHLSSTD
jgi:hypothetical protein